MSSQFQCAPMTKQNTVLNPLLFNTIFKNEVQTEWNLSAPLSYMYMQNADAETHKDAVNSCRDIAQINFEILTYVCLQAGQQYLCNLRAEK